MKRFAPERRGNNTRISWDRATSGNASITAVERRETNLKGFSDFDLKAWARICLGLSYTFHIHWTAALCNLAGLKRKAGAPLEEVRNRVKREKLERFY